MDAKRVVAGGPEATQRGSPIRALLIIVFGIALLSTVIVLRSAPPPVVGADAPGDVFSGERAVRLLRELLAEQKPHPAGSEENRRVRERIVARLDDLGIEVEVQSSFACAARWPSCATVENVVARIAGRAPGEALLLMAHYDSVPAAPGAGDDGAGVAALLETARIVSAEAPYRNPVLLVFTDGEELGLLGAEAFFREHRWAADVGVVLNVEGSGSEGQSLLLRPGPNSRSVISAYKSSAPRMVADSLFLEVFRLMPNDTDFSVAQRRGLRGLDFAFAGERNHYHSPLDTIDRLDPRSLQHHGENLLGLVRSLADLDLASLDGGDLVFFSPLSLALVAWPRSATPWLALVPLLAFGAAGWLVVRKRETTPVGIVIGAALFASVVLAATGASTLLVFGVGWLRGSWPPWPAYPWPWRLVVWGSSLGVALAIVRPLARRAGFWGTALGGWSCWVVIGLLAALVAPGATTLVLPATVVAGLAYLLLAVSRPTRSAARELVVVLTALLAAPQLLQLAVLGESTQGVNLTPMIGLPLALVATTIAPLVSDVAERSVALRAAVWLGTTVVVSGLLAALAVPLYSERRPRPVNLIHFQDRDRGEAAWLVETRGRVPEPLAAVAAFERPEDAVRWWLPPRRRAAAASAELTAEPPPELAVLEETVRADRRRLRLKLSSARGARSVQAIFPDGRLEWLAVGGQRVDVAPGPLLRAFFGTGVQVSIGALPIGGVELDLEVRDTDPLEVVLVDSIAALPPAAAPLLAARAPLAQPVQSGDRSLIVVRRTF